MRRQLSVLVTSVLLVTTALAGTLVSSAPTAAQESCAGPAEHTARDAVVNGAYGTDIAITVFRPAGAADADGCRVPVILHGHGWGGSRDTDVSDVDAYLDEGYAVVSIDQRGHGESGGQAHVMHPRFEVRDVQAIIDDVAQIGWVETEDEGDPVLGAIGGSYGGGYQLMTALHDDRFDALVPEITWNDLPYALAPNGAVKTAWNDLLYAAGVASVDLPTFIHAGFAWGAATNTFPDGEAPGEPDLEGRFTESSPFAHPAHGHQIEAPTLIIQGMNDTLFNLNQAVWNAHQIAADEGPPAFVEDDEDDVKLVTHLGGHVISTDGTLGNDDAGTFGLQPGDGGSPCGDETALQIAWFDRHLKEVEVAEMPRVQMALDDGTCVTGETIDQLVLQDPAEGTPFELAGPTVITQPSPVTTGYVEVADQAARAPSPIQIEVLTASQERTLAGVPYLTGDITVGGADAIVYLSLVVEDADGDQTVLNSQVTPLKHRGPAQAVPFALELGGVGTQLDPGETLYLEISTNDPQYNANQERLPGAVLLEDLTLDLPITG